MFLGKGSKLAWVSRSGQQIEWEGWTEWRHLNPSYQRQRIVINPSGKVRGEIDLLKAIILSKLFIKITLRLCLPLLTKNIDNVKLTLLTFLTLSKFFGNINIFSRTSFSDAHED